ncbi:MAG: SIR2 family protein [Desulfovibrio sp.]
MGRTKQPGEAATPAHSYRISGKTKEFQEAAQIDPSEERKSIEPWLSAIFQCEHLSCLIGNGLTCAVSAIAGVTSAGMGRATFQCPHGERITKDAEASARTCNRGTPNLEDDLRIAAELLAGLRILRKQEYEALKTDIDSNMNTLLRSVLDTERKLKESFTSRGLGFTAEGYLLSFLMSFASRLPSRERLNIFTTNYDRLIEHGCDKAGIRIIDRFVGALSPVFRSSRLNIDMHYNPPGIRGEPRYLEGVARLFKLHGSLDWRTEGEDIVRHGIAFGAKEPGLPEAPSDSVMIYPNAAKDVETLNHPYAELFRDFAAAVCRPNAALVVYGFSFGDEHINRIIRDMLKIPSTHLVIIARSRNPRIERFINEHQAQVSCLLGTHFSDLKMLVRHYLPKPAIDPIQVREKAIKDQRDPAEGQSGPTNTMSDQDIKDLFG